MTVPLPRTLRSLTAARPLTGLRYRELIGPVAAGTATLLASLTLTVVSAWLITRAWQMPPVMDLSMAVTAVRALGVSRAAFRYLDRLVSHGVALRCAGTARVNAYRLLASAPAGRTAAVDRGRLVTTLTDDISAVADVIVRSVVPSLVFVTTGVASVAFTALLSVPAAVVLTVGLFIAGALAPWSVARSVQVASDNRAANMRRYATALDRVLTGSAALRVRGELDGALADARSAAAGLTAAAESGAPARAVGAGLSVVASTATVVGVLAVTVTAYTTGEHSPQWLGVLVLLATAAFESTAVLPEAADAAVRARGAADRLSSLLNNGDMTDSPGSSDDIGGGRPVAGSTPRLRAEGLGYGHDRTLGTVDLDLSFGSRHTVTAASGSGKTTLLMTLAGLLEPRSGTVTLDGCDIADLSPEQLHRTVAYLPEDAHVFATTVRDNLAVGAPDASDSGMVDTLRAVGLGDWVRALPSGLDTVLTDGAESLSGGQRRRLLLARMLLTDAPVLLLDEPFEHLDDAGTRELEDVLAGETLPGRRPVRTVVVVRHPRDAGQGHHR